MTDLHDLKRRVDEASGEDFGLEQDLVRFFISDEEAGIHRAYFVSSYNFTDSMDAVLGLAKRLDLPWIAILREAIRCSSGDLSKLPRCTLSALLAARIAEVEQ